MKKYIQVLVLLAGTFIGESGKGADFISNATGTNAIFGNPSTWIITNGTDDDGIPDADDNVIITNGHSVFVEVDAAYTIRSLTIGTSDLLVNTTLRVRNRSTLNVLENCHIYSGGAEVVDEEDEDAEADPTLYMKRIFIGSNISANENTRLIIGGDLIIAARSDLDPNNVCTGMELLGASQLLLAGNISLPHNRGVVTAVSTASTVTLNGTLPQQIYMGYGTGIEYPNLVVDGYLVTVIADPLATGVGQITGDLIVKSGVFDNGSKKIDVGKDILIEEGATFQLSGGSTISVNNTNVTLEGKLITEHVDGLGGFKPLGAIGLGNNAEIEYAGNLNGQVAGFHWFSYSLSYPKLTFNNVNGTSLDRSVSVGNLTIESGAVFNGTNNNGIELTVTENWTNNGTFNGQTGTVRLAGTASTLLGTGVNKFNHLIIESGVDFSAPDSLTVSGNLIVNAGGSFNHNNGKVVFKPVGGPHQTSGVGQFWDVRIEGGGVIFNGQDTINHELYLQTGSTSSVNGSLTLDLNTGYINPEGNGGLNGDLTLIKSASKKGYTAVSLPVAASVSELKSAGFEYVFRYDDKAAPYYLVPLTNGSMTLAADGKAYACHSEETNSSNAAIRVTGSYDNTRLLVSVPVVSTPVNGKFTAGYTGWNLIGNPFAFDVDWDELIELSGNNAIYRGLYYQMGDRFQAYIDQVPSGGYNKLSPMQGAMVYLSNPGNTPINNTFTFSKEAGLASSNILRRKAQPTNVLKLNVSNGQYSDATYVRLSSDATVGFDSDMDAYKFRNGGSVPSFFSYKDGVNYSINSVPDIFGKYSMLLAFEPKVAGTYTITLSEEYTYDLPYEIYLEDKVLNVMHPIGLDQSYTFSTNLEERSGRFTLHFENAVITAMESSNHAFVRVFSEGRDVVLTGADVEDAADVRLYDVAGRMVAEFSRVDLQNKTFSFKVGAIPGVYIVNVVAGDKISSERVVIY